jgi:hypothetical protein
MIIDIEIEKVAAGLRAMKNIPEYFLFSSSGELTYDKKEILGIIVLHTSQTLLFNDDIECPFWPLWNNEGDYISDVVSFRKAYENE